MADSGWKEFKTSAGVTLLYGPFPGAMYWDIMDRALREHPDPEPPTAEIDVVDGKETVENLDDPEYKAALARARNARADVLGKAILEMCVEPPEGWEGTLDRLGKKYVDLPADPVDRKVWYLSKYAIRTPKDWQVIRRVQSFSQIEDEEVAARAATFPGDVEGAEGPGADAPGAA